MKIEKVICDNCEKECDGGYAKIFLYSSFIGEVIGTNEICPDCYGKMKQALDKKEET